MTHCLRAFFFSLLVVLLSAPFARAERVEQLKPKGYVNDFASVIDSETEARLTALCAELDRKTHAQMAVVTIRSLEGLGVEEFGHRLATSWGVGYKGDNRGVLILLAISDRKYRIEVGYGLEPILPDGKVGGFGREMVPQLRQGDYSGALIQLTGRIAAVIAQDRGVTLVNRPGAAPPLVGHGFEAESHGPRSCARIGEATTATGRHLRQPTACRWTAAGLLEAEKKFRKVKGYRELKELNRILNPELHS